MKTIKFNNWKYKYHAICAIIGIGVGFSIASALWLNVGSEKKITEIEKKLISKEAEAKILTGQLSNALEEAKEYKKKDSLNEIKLNAYLLEIKNFKNSKNEKFINAVDYFTDYELQGFITERYSSGSSFK